MPPRAAKKRRQPVLQKRARSGGSSNEERVQPPLKARQSSNRHSLNVEDTMEIDEHDHGNEADDDEYCASTEDESEEVDDADDEVDGDQDVGVDEVVDFEEDDGEQATRGLKRSYGQRNTHGPSDDDGDDSDSSSDDSEDGDESSESDLDSIDSDSDIEVRARATESRKKLPKQTHLERLQNGFHALSKFKELEKIAIDSPSKLLRAFYKTKKWLKKRPCPKDLGKMIPAVESLLSQGWTEELEADFLEGWMRSDEVRYIETVEIPASNTSFLAMWRKIPRVCNVLPTGIIARVYHLEYGATKPAQRERKGKKVGRQFPDPIWTPRFCDNLVTLALGGPWMGNMKLLSCMILYAKACQIDDRRSIVFNHNTTDGFMHIMQERLAQADRGQSIPEVHKEVRKAAGERCLPAYSSLMRKIEKQFFVSQQEPMEANNARATCNRVEISDLRDLIRVIRSVKDAGGPHWPSLNEKARLASTARAAMDAPKDVEEFRDLYLKSRLADWRAEWLKNHPTADEDASES